MSESESSTPFRMTNIDVEQTGISEGEPSDYKPVKVDAWISIVLSAISFVALITVYFWVIPFLTLLYAVTVARKLHKSREAYAGQNVANFSVLISLTILIVAPTKHFIERSILISEARDTANAYFDNILAGNLKVAFAYRALPSVREGMDNKKLEDNIRMQSDNYRKYLQQPDIVGLRGELKKTSVTIKGPDPNKEDWGTSDQGNHFVVLYYHFHRENKPSLKLKVLCVGSTSGGDAAWKGRKWWITRVEPYQ